MRPESDAFSSNLPIRKDRRPDSLRDTQPVPAIKTGSAPRERVEAPEVRVVHEKRIAAPAAQKQSAAVQMATKSPLQSKKFVAYIIAQVVWATIMIMMIYKWQEKSLMAGMVAASCVLQIVYLAGQARIDLDLSKGHIEIESDEDGL